MMPITQAAALNRLSLSESDTNLIISGQLQKILQVTFGYSQTSLNSLILSKNAIGVNRETKHEQYSGSPEHYRYSDSAVIQNGCNNENQEVITCSQLSPLVGVKLNQQVNQPSLRGSVRRLCGSLSPAQNQRSPELDCKIKNDSSNLRNDNANLRNYKNQHLVEQHVRTYKTFVVHRVTVSKPVQPFGTQRALNWRLIPFSCLLNSCLMSSSSEFNASNLSGNPLLLISFTAASSSRGLLNSAGKILSVSPVIKAILCLHSTVAGQSHEIPIWLATSKTFTSYRSVLLLLSAENVYSMIFLPSSLLSIANQSFGSSLAFLRCSPLSLRPQASSTHAEKFAPGLSAFSRSTLASISSINSYGKRIPLKLDLLFLLPVAIRASKIKLDLCLHTIRNNYLFKRLDVFIHHNLSCLHTLSTGGAHITKPGSVSPLTGPLTTNDSQRIEVAMLNHTPTRFKFLFLAVHRSDLNAKPHREAVTAHSEQDARRSLAGQFVLSFAGRIPAQGVCNA